MNWDVKKNTLMASRFKFSAIVYSSYVAQQQTINLWYFIIISNCWPSSFDIDVVQEKPNWEV